MATKSGVENTSPEYKANKDKWTLNRLMETADILLPHEWKKHLFVPAQHNTQKSQDKYIKGADLFPAMKRTLEGSMGVVFRKPTQIELPEGLRYLEDDANGDGTSLDQFIRNVTRENILQGYGAILTDFSRVEEPGSLADDANNNNFATMHIYQAESIRYVFTRKEGASTVVYQIILHEEYEKVLDQFTVEVMDQYRVLLLDDDGLYIQQIYRPADSDAVNDQGLIETLEPRNSAGQRLDYIPLSFFGSESNSWFPTGSPMYGLTSMNARHVEHSATRTESIRLLAPTLFVDGGDGFNYERFEEETPGGIVLGANKAYILEKGGKPYLFQASPNDAASTAMDKIEDRMVKAGALLVTPQASNVSEETMRLNRSTETSVLGMLVRNVEAAMLEQLGYVMDFMGVTGEASIDINRDFFDLPMTAQDRAQWMADVMAGHVTAQEYREALVKSGQLPESALEEDVTFAPLPEPLVNDDELDGEDEQQ